MTEFLHRPPQYNTDIICFFHIAHNKSLFLDVTILYSEREELEDTTNPCLLGARQCVEEEKNSAS